MSSPTPLPPSWPHCGAPVPGDPVGCHGAQVPGSAACLAHVTSAERTAYLSGLSPGADVDHRGTPFTARLLDQLMDALRHPGTGWPRAGHAWFVGAVFSGKADFERTTFTGVAWFERAVFAGEADFDRAVFGGDAQFDGARFAGPARFGGEFRRLGWFPDTVFADTARFDGAHFAGAAGFDRAVFHGDVHFDGATVAGNAWFRAARFTDTSRLGPLVCGRHFGLARAVFSGPVTIEAAAAEVDCTRTRWESTATLRLRYADVDLSDAVPALPVAVAAHPAPFTGYSGASLAEPGLAGHDPGVRVVSLRGVDAAQLVLTDTDLSRCVLTGAFHLDQLRLEGDTRFAAPPTGWRLRAGLPARLARRRVLAEEHHWRALAPANPAPPRGWTPGPQHPDPALTPGPNDVAPVYRALRKASEDAKNEPDAADFYYGEMEMRRHDRRRPTGERALLTGYWLLSGYGLRTTRALGWLLAAMTASLFALLLYGVPTNDTATTVTGRPPTASQDLALTVAAPDAQVSGPLADRFTAARAKTAGLVVVNSVVFRSSGQNLTFAGACVEMTSRLVEPVLLGLAVLAIRSRVKR